MPADVKICGLTRAVDAEFADAAGVQYLGVIFAGGPRERTPMQARETVAGRRARRVGVFSTQPEDAIATLVDMVGLQVVQLHADADPGRVQRVRAATGAEVWAVIRTADGVLPDGVEALCEAADALLIDALAPSWTIIRASSSREGSHRRTLPRRSTSSRRPSWTCRRASSRRQV